MIQNPDNKVSLEKKNLQRKFSQNNRVHSQLRNCVFVFILLPSQLVSLLLLPSLSLSPSSCDHRQPRRPAHHRDAVPAVGGGGSIHQPDRRRLWWLQARGAGGSGGDHGQQGQPVSCHRENPYANHACLIKSNYYQESSVVWLYFCDVCSACFIVQHVCEEIMVLYRDLKTKDESFVVDFTLSSCAAFWTKIW